MTYLDKITQLIEKEKSVVALYELLEEETTEENRKSKLMETYWHLSSTAGYYKDMLKLDLDKKELYQKKLNKSRKFLNFIERLQEKEFPPKIPIGVETYLKDWVKDTVLRTSFEESLQDLEYEATKNVDDIYLESRILYEYMVDTLDEKDGEEFFAKEWIKYKPIKEYLMMFSDKQIDEMDKIVAEDKQRNRSLTESIDEIKNNPKSEHAYTARGKLNYVYNYSNCIGVELIDVYVFRWLSYNPVKDLIKLLEEHPKQEMQEIAKEYKTLEDIK